METRSEMGDPMARADKLRMQKQVLAIFGDMSLLPLEMCSCKLQKYVGLPNMHLYILVNTQVSDLVDLTKQQAVTIRRLERDSLAKSDRIADIETRWPRF